MKVKITQARAAISTLTPGSPASDLNLVIRTDYMCSVKCAEAAWKITSQEGIMHYTLPAFICFYYLSE